LSAVAEQVVPGNFEKKIGEQFPRVSIASQSTVDKIETLWISRNHLLEIIEY